MSGFICPICKAVLKNEKTRLVCEKNHSFDKSAQGHCYLLSPNKKNSKIPGDNKEMVNARRAFLEKGYYDSFANKISQIATKLLVDTKTPFVLDAGCGEGYYTARIHNALSAKISRLKMVAFDISKFAILAAAKKYPQIHFVVASSFDIPVADKSVDLLVNIFAPVCEKEMQRVVKKDGYFLYAVPTPEHLLGLKQVLYTAPYPNTRHDKPYLGFELVQRVTVENQIDIEDNQTILQLFSMTPYYWKTPIEGTKKLAENQTLKTQIGFDLLVYKKVK